MVIRSLPVLVQLTLVNMCRRLPPGRETDIVDIIVGQQDTMLITLRSHTLHDGFMTVN